MFSGKREKALLEEELAALRETEKRERELLHKIAGQKDTAEEQFARMTASRAQMEKEIEEIEQQMQQNGELSENGAQAAGELHNTLITMNNGIATFDANHSVFMEQVKGQNEKVVEIVENNKHFTTPMKHISEAPQALREMRQALGGGTPTTLEPEELERLFLKLQNTLDWSQVREFTVEAGRADSITAEKLRVMKRYGVTRISVNPQTMKQETLDLIGRRHTVAQTVEAFRLAREEGFDNINMDLILGLPGETKEDVEETIRRVQELGPDSLTVHSLAIKRASRLSQWILEHGISTLHNTDETMAIAAQGAKQMGMEPYYLYRQKNMSGNFVNVGYAKPGKAGIYNILIMEEVQTIMALGAGTISKRVYGDGRIERCDNVKDVGQYIERIDEMIQRKQQLFSEE